MTTWTAICSLHDIPVLGARRVRRARGMDVAVFRTGADEVHALLDRCPHQGGQVWINTRRTAGSQSCAAAACNASVTSSPAGVAAWG